MNRIRELQFKFELIYSAERMWFWPYLSRIRFGRGRNLCLPCHSRPWGRVQLLLRQAPKTQPWNAGNLKGYSSLTSRQFSIVSLIYFVSFCSLSSISHFHRLLLILFHSIHLISLTTWRYFHLGKTTDYFSSQHSFIIIVRVTRRTT